LARSSALLQIGGALGVAVIGSLLATRYQDHITIAPAPYHLPPAVLTTILGSVGGALGVAVHVGGPLGAALAHLARSAFISGMDLGLATGAIVAAAGGLLALAALPARPARPAGTSQPPAPSGREPGSAALTSNGPRQ
jgi:hypothetical protein